MIGIGVGAGAYVLAKFAVSLPTLGTPGQAQRVTPGATGTFPDLPSLLLSFF